MATLNPQVASALTGYVEDKAFPLLTKAVLGAKSAKLFNVITGIKGPTRMTSMDTDIVFGDGSVCGWNEAGDTNFSARELVPARLQVQKAFCSKNLYDTWMQVELKTAAGENPMPFNEQWTSLITEKVADAIEKMIYVGDSTNTGQTEFDGLIKTLSGSTAVAVEAATGSTAFEFVKNVYMSIPETEVNKPDTAILISDGLFRQYIQDLITANLYHAQATGSTDNAMEYTLPGTAVRVIAVPGLNGASEDYEFAIAGRLSNIYYGCDLMGDEENFDLWYSKDDGGVWKLQINAIVGTNVAFPDLCVFGTLPK